MELWILPAFLIFLQSFAQPIKVDDSTSQFLIVENPQEVYQKNDLVSDNDHKYQPFHSNRSHPRTKPNRKYPISPPTIQSINLLGVETPEENVRKGGKFLAPSVEITPAHSQYLGYTIGGNIQDVSTFSKAPKKNFLEKDQSILRSPVKDRSPTRHNPKKYTNVKFSNVENTIHRPRTSDHPDPEKKFPSHLEDLIEKAQHLDHKIEAGPSRKHRNSDDDAAGHRSDKYELEEYLDHQPYVENDGEYHVYHGEKKKKKEVHYHQHKHLHEHDHDQKHTHKHQGGHHHDHGHDHRQKHSHSHGHDDDHWHEHRERGEHRHQSHHDHDHRGSHDHKHGEDHDHKHDSGHHHGHEDHHDHREEHKSWHGHKHESGHDHRHGHDHKHKGKHGHDHRHDDKHKHDHHHKHAGKH